jgi:medium-chain acyl-[acyl-carrier-protein] hydrolase
VRPSSHIPEILERDTSTVDPYFREIPAFPGDAEAREIPWPIRFHDLDVNGHVNNAAYFEWIFEATPLDPMEWDIRSISASFRSSARFGDALLIRSAELEPAGGVRTFIYNIVKPQAEGVRSAKPMTAFICSWEPRS